MSSQLLRLITLGSLGLSLCLGNSAAMAQYDPYPTDEGVVVPTVPSGGTSAPVPIDTSTGIPPSPSTDGTTRFTCQTYNGQYTVMYQPQSQPGQYFPWAAPAALGGGWDAEKRCVAIANRLELYRPDGLQELQTSVQNNENIVCVTSEANPTCRIVLTVPRGKDAVIIRNSIFQNLTTADSGQQTVAVNTYGDRSGNSIYNLGRTLLGNGNNNRVSSYRGGINLKPFLDTKDGGTARNLRNGVAVRRQSQPNSVRLNPGNFR
ncbi:MAG: COP23 domain-containing protein [Nostoc sp. DedQUE01]|nr:COP23 domain-containing protein [Nostoc sp. DedQUE11]MDZ8074947.1 COP23 domain-containing protein [Nostoc sp. DedQUE01]MDZ8077882.1 COP23 domain-containing protein [Nostoc sp. DcaGUA01]